MKVMKITAGIVCFMFAIMGVRADNDAPPEELFSPDRNFSVRMLQTPMPGVDPDDLSCTLAVVVKGKIVSKQATEGYLIKAFWNADNYVAVNNRRANSGDYLWVFSLKNGHPLRIPDDNAIQPFIDEVAKKFPECVGHEFHKRLTEASGWKSADELTVRTNISFEKMDVFFVLTDTYRIKDDRLVLEESSIEKKPL